MLKFLDFYLEKQKSFTPKKNLSCCPYQKKKALFTGQIFIEGFGIDYVDDLASVSLNWDALFCLV